MTPPFSAWTRTRAPHSRASSKRPEERRVVHLQDPGIGQVELEGGDALVAGQAGHLGERRLAHAAQGHVEAVVDGRLALGLPPPRFESGEERLAGLRGGEVDDGGRAAEGCGAGPGLEVVGRGEGARRHVEVRVGVDPARQDEAARGVDRRVRRQAQALAHEGDLPAVNIEIRLVALRRGDDAAVADERGRHLLPLSSGALCRDRGRSRPGRDRASPRLPRRRSASGPPPGSPRPRPSRAGCSAGGATPCTGRCASRCSSR